MSMRCELPSGLLKMRLAETFLHPWFEIQPLPMPAKNITFDFDTIELAFQFANSDPSNEAYLDRHTGESLYISPYGDSDADPDDLQDDSRYVLVPDLRDYGLGSQLARRFAADKAPHLGDDVYDIFSRRGAYRRFKDLLNRHGQLDAWYEYEAEHERVAIVDWCEENDIRYTIRENTTDG